MRSFKTIPVVIIILLLSGISFAVYGTTLNYSLQLDEELSSLFHVKIKVENAAKKRYVFSMPVWMPGSYYRTDFGKNVLNVRGVDDFNKTLHVEKLSPNDWEIRLENAKSFTLSYDVQVPEFDFLGKIIDSTGVLVQGASTWMYIKDMEGFPVSVSFKDPQQRQVEVALPGKNNLYFANSYHQLADSPVIIGVTSDTTIFVKNVPHHICFRGTADFDKKSFVKMISDIVTSETALFQDVPYDQYMFQFLIYPGYRGGSGLEHANSTTISLSGVQLMENVHNAANIIAHEFFHLWNVKRLSHKLLLPPRYDRDARMGSLWWLEGVTSYYSDLTLLRTGIWSVDDFLASIAKEIEILLSNPDRFQTSLVDASWNVWENGYFGPGISYYNKGHLVGFVLDIMIRKVTDNQVSLDDILLEMYKDYSTPGNGFKDSDIQRVVERMTGFDFGAFFDRYVSGTVEIPFDDLLGYAEIQADINKTRVPTIGPFRTLGNRTRIFSIEPMSPVAKAGLKRNDIIKTLNYQNITHMDDIEDIVINAEIGDTLHTVIERDGYELIFKVVVAGQDQVKCELNVKDVLLPAQKRIIDGLLKGH